MIYGECHTRLTLSFSLVAEYGMSDFNVFYMKILSRWPTCWISAKPTLYILRYLSFFIKAIVKNCMRYKAVEFKVTWDLYWVMYRSSCGLIWPLRGYKVLPLFVRILTILGLNGSIKYQCPVRKDLYGVLEDPDSNDLWKIWQVPNGDGQERAKVEKIEKFIHCIFD